MHGTYPWFRASWDPENQTSFAGLAGACAANTSAAAIYAATNSSYSGGGYNATGGAATLPATDGAVILRAMLGLTGTAEQVKAAANAYKVYYKKQDTGDQYYTMDHSTFTYLMLPGAGFVDFFNRDDTAQQMADRTACFLGKG